MANNNEKEVIDNLEREWNEYNGEYEVDNAFAPQPIRSKTTFGKITSEDGFEFETTQQNEAEREEINKKNNYWTREEILTHLDTDPKPDDDICEDSDVFDERIKYMENIFNEGVFKRVIRHGFGDIITENSAVLYNLNAYLEGQDEPFDSTWLRGRPNLHKLSYDTLLPGLCKGLLTMKRGERSEIIVRPNYVYRKMGCPPRTPAKATILYIVEVIKVFEEGSGKNGKNGKNLGKMDMEERHKVDFKQMIELCHIERICGNSYFKAGRYREAAFRYRRAIRCLEQMTYRLSDDEIRVKEVLVKLYSNIAYTYNKLQMPFNAMSNCKRALAIDDKSHKALYQYGLAKMANAHYQEAKHYLMRAFLLKPKSQEINLALHRLDQRMNGDRIVEEKL